MRLALLNADAIAWSAAQSRLAEGDAVLVWASELGALAPEVKAVAPAARFDEPWETLLAGNVADLVLVGQASPASEERVAEQLGKLLRAEVRLAVSYPPRLGVLAAYELEMVREELRGELRPLAPSVTAPGAAALVAQVRSGALGDVEQVVCQRNLAAADREATLQALAGDLLLARELAGELTRVAALAPPGEQVRYEQLGVQLSGPRGALVRWAAACDPESAGALVTVIGSRGRASCMLPEQQAPPTAAPVAGREAPSWLDAIRGLELVEAVERSLMRGKTIDLAARDTSESGTFKALMSAAGCLLLLTAPLILVTALALARVPALQPLVQFVPAALALALLAFLGLQALRWALPEEPKQSG